MAEQRSAATWNDGPELASGLFSVDADSHLRKLAACMFPTPAQLPVELVRASLARSAKTVAVVIRRRRLSLADDGQGIAAPYWRELAKAFDPGLDAAARENAIRTLQEAAATGIGLLAVFVPGALSIRIESSSPDGTMAMEIKNGRAQEQEVRPGKGGTRITIRRRPGPAGLEKKLLRELCASVPEGITLNGRALERKPLLRRSLASLRVDIGPGCEPALVSIPVRGDVCRIWLLDRQIPWQAYASASYHGLVFEAAMEAGSLPSAEQFRLLADASHRLYLWLASQYPAFPAPHQERIEELIFNRAKAAGDLRLLSAFSPFRLWRSTQRLNLDEVRRKAERRALYVLPVDGDPGQRIGRHQEALLLSPRQRDFLLNHLRLPLVEPEAAMGGKGRLARLFAGLSRRAAGVTARLPRFTPKALAWAEVSEDEKRLCRGLERQWQERHHEAPPPRLAVAMAAGRRLLPAVVRQSPQGSVLYLRRRHPLVLLAVRCVAADSANAELAFAALAPVRLLTPGAD